MQGLTTTMSNIENPELFGNAQVHDGRALSKRKRLAFSPPTPVQAEILRAIGSGDELQILPGGGAILTLSGRTISHRTFSSLLRRGWVTEPDLPLFGDRAGVLTDRGRAELSYL